jgi:hypothetical protein
MARRSEIITNAVEAQVYADIEANPKSEHNENDSWTQCRYKSFDVNLADRKWLESGVRGYDRSRLVR